MDLFGSHLFLDRPAWQNHLSPNNQTSMAPDHEKLQAALSFLLANLVVAPVVQDPQVFLSHEAKSDKLLYHGRQGCAKSCIIYLKEPICSLSHSVGLIKDKKGAPSLPTYRWYTSPITGS